MIDLPESFDLCTEIRKLYVSKNLNMEPAKIMLAADFINFCKEHLSIEYQVN